MLRRLARIGVAREDFARGSSPLARRLRRISALERREEARAFLDAYHDATGASRDQRRRRWAEVRRGLAREGFYEHSPAELAFGARLAWRNHGRCIGRLYWESLEVVDARALTSPEAMAGRIARHMAEALGDGRIRSVISVFAPVRGTALPGFVESPQITQYAGHVRPDGSILGDRRNVEATRIARSFGWAAPDEPGRFDLLPYFVRDDRDRRTMFALPPGTVREVPIAHPACPDLAALGLRWYAVPCVSGMILTIGGIDYPCAPFNGFYMCTEIASRNLADRDRYDLLPEIARALGLDPAGRDPLWRDTALTELNRAVLHSYRAAGVTMLDHHAASDQFMEFHGREQAQGRQVAGDWRWIVPPQAGGACEVFHLRMRNFHPVPNYYTSRADDGLRLMPWYGDRYRPLPQRALDRVRRRWKLWSRIAW
ncbi:nitric oxide synthase oxygenase [Rubellimicrobium aerolatum]|uniref:Nitric oxide synthase oxygenase n=1 Tax=Rubellimicrobium aerolatum TaxID=490979 RepID=A0ABW0SGJ8_9RHOB|nr:nitric oxide synthase oxygenase [Rubellimicrobium aerolatum]MBP1807496.1 nitric-oxide synthase [Rubellimicrobium aerolatum]